VPQRHDVSRSLDLQGAFRTIGAARISLFVILTNKEVLAVDQDAKGVQGRRVAREGPLEVWAKPLANGSTAVGLFNRGESTNPVTINFKDIGVSGSAKVRNLWSHADLGSSSESYTVEIPRHGAVLISIR
jgi:alpha-galactosidase